MGRAQSWPKTALYQTVLVWTWATSGIVCFWTYWWIFPFSFFNILGILAGIGTDLGWGFCVPGRRMQPEQLRWGRSRCCQEKQPPAPVLLSASHSPMLFISTWGFFPFSSHFIHFVPSPSPVCPVPSRHSLTCNGFPSGTADPKDVMHLLPPLLNPPVQELTSGTFLFRLTSDLSAPRADPEPETGMRDLLIFISSWLEMRRPKVQTPTIPNLLYSLKSDPSFATSQLLLPRVDALPSSLQLQVQKRREEQLLTAFCSFTAN